MTGNDSSPAIYFSNLQVGDVVTRMLGGSVPMMLTISAVTDTLIICGGWKFCRKTGVEIDEGLGWGPQYGITGSFLLSCKPN